MDVLSSRKPLQTLSILFVSWKFVILLIAILSPATGYDASTLQLFTIAQRSSSSDFPANPAFTTHPLSHLALKLSRWDAIYFLSIADRGYLYEQEWAFSWGWSKLIRLLSGPFTSAVESSLVTDAIAGILLAHFSHYASVILLYNLTLRLTPNSSQIRQRIAFVAAALHIVAPAGIFLSAPVAEALTSALTFAGILLFTYSTPRSTIASGIVFGLAATVRSNVLLNGLFFLGDVFLRHLPNLYSTSRAGKHINATTVINLCATVTAGTVLAIGFIIPQAIAWATICHPFPAAERADWCHAIPPSIYTHVQSKYWNVGFLRYWTVPNLPLFAMAAPMILALTWSAVDVLCSSVATSMPTPTTTPFQKSTSVQGHPQTTPDRSYYLSAIAVPQLLLALLATTSFHVQIITRLASSCPLLYIWLAHKIVTGPSAASDRNQDKRKHIPTRTHAHQPEEHFAADTMVKIPWRTDRVRFSHIAVRYMVMYALVQAGLFASFLPPA